MVRKIWVKMKLPSLYENVAESMWRAMVWVCNEKENAVIDSLKYVYQWRSVCRTHKNDERRSRKPHKMEA